MAHRRTRECNSIQILKHVVVAEAVERGTVCENGPKSPMIHDRTRNVHASLESTPANKQEGKNSTNSVNFRTKKKKTKKNSNGWEPCACLYRMVVTTVHLGVKGSTFF